MSDKIAITRIDLSKNSCVTREKIKIVVNAFSITKEPINQRFSFVLGNKSKIKV